MFCLHLGLCNTWVPGTHGCQKSTLDPWEQESMDSCELPCKCWNPNLGPPGKQSVFLYCWVISPAPILTFFSPMRSKIDQLSHLWKAPMLTNRSGIESHTEHNPTLDAWPLVTSFSGMACIWTLIFRPWGKSSLSESAFLYIQSTPMRISSCPHFEERFPRAQGPHGLGTG